MQYLQNQAQKNIPKFTPAFQALNKNADGFICSINTQQHDITKSRIESRLEFYKNQKQGATGMAGGMFNQQQQSSTLGGGGMFGGGLSTGGMATGGLGGGLAGGTLGGGGALGGGTLGGGLVGLGSGTGGLGGLGTGQTTTLGGGFGLGQTQSQPNATGGLLGQTGGFGATSTPLLGGTGTSTLLGGQQTTSQPLFGASTQQQTGLFGQSTNLAAPQQQGLSFASSGLQFGQAAPQQIQQQQTPQLAVAQPQQIIYTQNFEITTQIQYDQEYEKDKLEELEEDFKNRFPTYSQGAYQKGISYENQKQQKIRKVEVSVKPKYPKMYTWKQVEQSTESVPYESQVQPKIQKVIMRDKANPNAPTCKNYQCTPTIDELKYFTDEELQQINDFVIENETGKIQFLDYVDLRNLDLDEVINLGQDSVEFYPENQTRPVPQKGKEINVRCHVTFKNFACNNKKMNELRIKNRREFEKRVYLWGEKCLMKIISISDDVTVQLEEI